MSQILKDLDLLSNTAFINLLDSDLGALPLPDGDCLALIEKLYLVEFDPAPDSYTVPHNVRHNLVVAHYIFLYPRGTYDKFV
jgi:hypothetical protein